jgi:hypothetical protein
MLDEGMIAHIKQTRVIEAAIGRHIDDDNANRIDVRLRDHNPQMRRSAIPESIARLHVMRRPLD